VRPSTAGYDFSSASETLSGGSFGVSGIVCSEGYAGTATATVCSEDQGDYSVSGCVTVCAPAPPGSTPDESDVVNVLEGHRTYSSTWNNDAPGATHARSMLDSGYGWSPATTNLIPGSDWLQMDLGVTRIVRGIVSQGRGDGCGTASCQLQYVTSYKVQYSLDGVHFEELPDEFAANTDVSTKVTNTLTDSIVARYVRVLPYGTDGGHLVMRAAVVIDDVAACWTCLGTSPPPPVVELHGRSGVSVALGQNAVGSGAGLWDGDHSSQYGWQAAVYSNQLSTCAESMVATVDLGEVYMTTGATLWRFYYQTTSRAYCNQKLAVSASGEFAGEETVVYEIPGCSGWCTDPTACTNAEAGDCTAANYGGFETADGTVLEWDATPARYIRQWSGRNNENTGSHLSEMTIAGYLSGS